MAKSKDFFERFLEKRKTARKNHGSGLSHKRKGNLNDYKAIISRLLAYVKQKMEIIWLCSKRPLEAVLEGNYGMLNEFLWVI